MNWAYNICPSNLQTTKFDAMIWKYIRHTWTEQKLGTMIVFSIDWLRVSIIALGRPIIEQRERAFLTVHTSVVISTFYMWRWKYVDFQSITRPIIISTTAARNDELHPTTNSPHDSGRNRGDRRRSGRNGQKQKMNLAADNAKLRNPVI